MSKKNIKWQKQRHPEEGVPAMLSQHWGPPTSHTPGPWIVDDKHVHCQNGFVYQDDRLLTDGEDLVCEVNTDCRRNGLLTDTDKANLRLIAAAPDLLRQLKKALAVIKDEYPASQHSEYGVPEIEAAIEKATT